MLLFVSSLGPFIEMKPRSSFLRGKILTYASKQNCESRGSDSATWSADAFKFGNATVTS